MNLACVKQRDHQNRHNIIDDHCGRQEHAQFNGNAVAEQHDDRYRKRRVRPDRNAPSVPQFRRRNDAKTTAGRMMPPNAAITGSGMAASRRCTASSAPRRCCTVLLLLMLVHPVVHAASNRRPDCMVRPAANQTPRVLLLNSMLESRF